MRNAMEKIYLKDIDYCDVCDKKMKKGYFKIHKRSKQHKKNMDETMLPVISKMFEEIHAKFDKTTVNLFFDYVRSVKVDSFDPYDNPAAVVAIKKKHETHISDLNK